MSEIIINNANYDRTFFGVSAVLDPEEGTETLDKETYRALNKHCENFQDLKNPPANGGEPKIMVRDTTPDQQVEINCSNLTKATMVNASKVRLRADEPTEVSDKMFRELEKNNRFQSLLESGALEVKD